MRGLKKIEGNYRHTYICTYGHCNFSDTLFDQKSPALSVHVADWGDKQIHKKKDGQTDFCTYRLNWSRGLCSEKLISSIHICQKLCFVLKYNERKTIQLVLTSMFSLFVLSYPRSNRNCLKDKNQIYRHKHFHILCV